MLLRDVHAWIDAAALVPSAIRVGVGPDACVTCGEDSVHDYAFRILEAMTALRLLRLSRYFHGFILLNKALKRSSSALLVPSFMLLVNVTFFGGLVRV